ncbi:hypothetical protein ABMA28_013188 [Loxostege sticticalis]|uniref:Uncharacterized protein n=3 Tax=Loxostege sticticalis TaxID=481309 RepID=A0ABD0THJ6_LOXSC
MSSKRKSATNIDSGRKFIKCHKCKATVDLKSTIKCLVCKCSYEFDCVGLSERLYRLMDPQKKKMWKCKLCISTCKQSSSYNKEESSNVTTRKKILTSKSNDEIDASQLSPIKSQEDDSNILTPVNITEENNTTTDYLSRSLDYTFTGSITIDEMKETVNKLKMELACSQHELDNTILENNELKRQVDKLTKENTTLMTLCRSPLADTSLLDPKKNNKSVKSPLRLFTPRSSSIFQDDMDTCEQRILVFQHKISDLEQKLKHAEMEILDLKDHIRSLKHITDIPKKPKSQQKPKLSTNEVYVQDRKNNIFIFGTQQCVNISSALIHSREGNVYGKYNIKSELKPYANSAEVLRNCKNIHL